MKYLPFFAAALATGAPGSAAENKPLNIVVLYADDWRHDTLGCAGNPVVKTPHLDQLAREGFRFTHNCVTTSICGVSRATLVHRAMDVAPRQSGVQRIQDAVGGDVSGLAARERLLRRPRRQMAQRQVPGGAIRFRPRLFGHALDEAAGRHADSRHAEERERRAGVPAPAPDGQAVLPDARVLRHARRGRQSEAVPAAAGEHVALSGRDDSGAEDRDRRGVPQAAALHRQREERRPRPLALALRHAGEISGDDEELLPPRHRGGRHLRPRARGAEEAGRCSTTRSSFSPPTTATSTASTASPTSGIRIEESIRVPLIVRDPRMAPGKRGGTNDDFTLNVDLAPTILAATGIAAPPTMQGRDLAPLYLADAKPTGAPSFSTSTRSFKTRISSRLRRRS